MTETNSSGTESVPETLLNVHSLTRLSAREEFIEYKAIYPTRREPVSFGLEAAPLNP
jgi:hypothetical protein